MIYLISSNVNVLNIQNLKVVLEKKEITYKGRRIFEKVVMTTDFRRIPKYFSGKEACFLFLTKGSFQFRTPTNLLSYKKNEAMLAKCGDYFIEQVSVKENSKEDTLAAIGAFFYPDIVKELFETDLSIQQFQKNFDVKKVNVEPLMKSFIDSINFLLDNPSVVDENMTINKLKELILILNKTENAASINAFVASLFVPYEYDFNEVIQSNLYTDLKIEDLAKLCNCSVATFKRKFKAYYHESPAKYLTTKKLEKASQLLQIKSKPVADVAYECGFETVTNFNRAFKLQYKKTPTQFRLS